MALRPPGDISNKTEYLSVENSGSTVFNSTFDQNDSNVSCSNVPEIATDFCSKVSDCPKFCKSAYGTLFEWMTKLRQGDDFDIKLFNRALPGSGHSKNYVDLLPVVVSSGVSGGKRRGRYKSSEKMKRRFVGKITSSTYTNIVNYGKKVTNLLPDITFVS